MSLDSLHAADLACKISLRLIATNEVVVYNKATDNPVLQKMVVSEAVKNEWTFPAMWAVRPDSGKSFGQSFVKFYEVYIRRMVLQGYQDKGQKMIAGQMQEQLKIQYPDRYDIPGTYSITAAVTKCLRNIRIAKASGRSVK